MKDISKRIKELRTERKMTQEELAERLYVTRQAVSGWETKKTRPDIETLEKISRVFSIDLTELLYGKPKKEIDRKKLAPIAVFAAAVALGFLLRLWAMPAIIAFGTESGIAAWLYTLAVRALYGCSVPLVFSVISIWHNVCVKNGKARMVLLIAGTAFSALFAAFWLAFFVSLAFGKTMLSAAWLYYVLMYIGFNKYTTVVIGALFYLGIKKETSKSAD